MEHYSEEILDLYARNSRVIADRKNEITQHLTNCAMCRSIAEDLSDFYALADATKQNLLERHSQEESFAVVPEYKHRIVMPQYVSTSLPALIFRFAKKHPATSSLSVIGILALVIFGLVQIRFVSDKNPAKYTINQIANRVEIFNRESQKLWEIIPTINLPRFENNEDSYSNEFMQVVDIDGDGRNEVISIFYVLPEQSSSNAVLTVYNFDGTIKFSHAFHSTVDFNGQHYYDIFSPRGLVVDDFDGDGKKELYVGVYHRNSPYVLYKVDITGNVLGEYWMYGHAFHLSELILHQKKFLALGGIDDNGTDRHALLTILDPTKLNGKQRGTLDKGYSFSESSAEEYIVRFPHTELDYVLGFDKPRVLSIFFQNASSFGVTVGFPYGKSPAYGVADFYFDEDLKPVDVKFVDKAVFDQNELKSKGKVKGVLNNEMKHYLMKNIEYWNGSKWYNYPLKVGE